MSETNGERAVVICTKYRGVFFGYAADTNGSTITLKRARMCVRWEAAMKGVMGLASQGPDEDCRVSDPVESIELRGVSAVLAVSDDAILRWESGPWK